MVTKYCTLILMMFLFILYPSNANAEIYTCDYKEKARLTSIASNVTISVDYKENNNQVEFITTLNNLHPDIYVKDIVKGVEYRYNTNASNPKELKIGGYKDGISIKYEFHSVKEICPENIVATKYVTTLPFNKYYNDPLCKANSNHSLCRKWIRVNYNYNDFKKQFETVEEEKPIEEEKEEIVDYINEIIQFIIKNYKYIIPPIILVGVAILYYFDRKKEFRF
ncbi:MAG: hypothetical protein PHI05_03700 [Bacilli bacterium]|nr:hypothetical protein [Bacilli bacterium]MDD4547825.1 hypothetical protein [Bacilli bacterium]